MLKPLKILQASAGSGKTFNLTAHYLILLFSGEQKYREILAVTFTNKATEEMKSRILTVLKGLATGDNSKQITDYSDLVLAAHPELSAGTLQQKAGRLYRKILHDYSRFAVSTIDGFVQKVIRGFAFELGLNADYTLEMNYDKVKNELVQKLDEQLNHNEQLLGWIIDLALERIAAGSNWDYKKELLTLIDEFFQDSYEVFESAMNTLTPDNLDQLFEKYISLTKAEIKNFESQFITLGRKAQEVYNKHQVDTKTLVKQSTSWLCKLKLFQELDYIKAQRVFELVDQPEAWFKPGAANTALFDELNPILKELWDFYKEKFAGFSLAIAFYKNLHYLRLMQDIALLLTAYRNDNDNLLISDAQKLIAGITDDAGDNPSFIWEKVGNKYRNFLFDEFQDTSVKQWKSFRSILSNALATPSGQLIDNLIVGDTKQSIYRWRNGDWNILHQQAKQEIGPENVVEDNLEENYRSTENIITFNNYLYQSLPITLQKELNTSIAGNAEELWSWWQESGYDKIITAVYAQSRQNLSPFTKPGGTIKVKRFGKDDAGDSPEKFSETVYQERVLLDVIEEIKVQLGEKKYQARDICILVSTNKQALLCVNALMAEEIPVLSGEVLLIANNAAVQLIINTLKVLVGIDKQTTLYKANCIALYHRLHQSEISPATYLSLNGKSLSQLGGVLPESLCANWQTWMQQPLIDLIEHLIEAYQLATPKENIPYLLAFRDLAANATRLGERGVINFLTWWEEDGIKKSLPSPEEANAVQVMTIHKAKGLAFRAVYVPFCNWGLKSRINSIFWVPAAGTPYSEFGSLPLKFEESLGNSAVAKSYYKELLDRHLDNLNILYVATTRAKDYLYLGLMGKASDSGIKTIGDALAKEISTIAEDNFDETNCYEIIDDLLLTETSGAENSFELFTYPTTSRLSALYIPQQEKHIQQVLNTEHSGRLGTIKHEVLANAQNTSEVQDYLEKMLLNGIISQEEITELHAEIMAVLHHPGLSAILLAGTESFIEKNIIDAQGKLHRPDRILLNADGVTIIDYKFTTVQQEQHTEQILGYKELLKQMGFSHIKGYLFYAHTNELKLVN